MGGGDDAVQFTGRGNDELILAVLRHDPAWAWLWDAEEDVYAEDDIQ